MDIIMVVMGWLAHHLKVLKEIREGTGEVWHPVKYIQKRPYAFFLSIVGTTIGANYVMVILDPSTQELIQNKQLALGVYYAAMAGVGVMGDMVADKFSSFAAKKLE